MTNKSRVSPEMRFNMDDLPSEYQLIMAAEPQSPWVNDTATIICARGPLGAWCGYAAVSRNHPWYGIPYTNADVILDVHGGLTFSGLLLFDFPEGVQTPDRANWWFGFDTAHGGDAVPGIIAALKSVNTPHRSTFDGDVYRTFDYVRSQAESLAKQLAEIDYLFIQSNLEARSKT